MFLSRRKLTECRSIFNNLALRVFRSCRRVRLPIIDKLLDYLYMLVTDSLYGSRAIEDCVKEAYGSDKTLFGCNALNGGVSGIKVGVTAITIPNSRLCILSNYNGNNHRQGISNLLQKSFIYLRLRL